MMRRSAAAIGLAALAWSAGCSVTVTGNPADLDGGVPDAPGQPDADPGRKHPLLDPDGVKGKPDIGTATNTLRVFGEDGAVVPANGIVRITSLDAPLKPADVEVTETGSFETHVPSFFGSELRMQVIDDDGQRSKPVDFVIQEDETLVVVDRPLQDCLTVVPESEVDFAQITDSLTRTVRVTNDCDAAVVLGAPTMRLPAASPVPDTSPTTATIAVGATLEIALTLAKPAAIYEEILFLHITAPTETRRPLTLLAE